MRLKITPGLQLIAGVVACLLVLALGYFLVVSPAKKAVDDTQTKIDDTQQQIQVEQNRAVQLKEFQKDPQQFLRQIDALKERLPENVQLSDVITQIDYAAEEAGLDFFSVKPNNPVSSGNFYSVDLEVVLNGRYFNLVEFFNHTERLPRTVKVVKLALVEDDDKLPYLQITLSMKAFFSSATGVDLLLPQSATAPTGGQ
jgi:type IV pilus assembly protein PilO